MALLYFVFNVDQCSFWVPLQPRQVVSMDSILKCISYLRVFISYLANIYCHLLKFSIILHRLQIYLVFSLLPVNSMLLSQKQPQFGARENYFHYQTLLQTIWQKQFFLSPVNFHLTGCCFTFQCNKQLLNLFNQLLYVLF